MDGGGENEPTEGGRRKALGLSLVRARRKYMMAVVTVAKQTMVVSL